MIYALLEVAKLNSAQNIYFNTQRTDYKPDTKMAATHLCSKSKDFSLNIYCIFSELHYFYTLFKVKLSSYLQTKEMDCRHLFCFLFFVLFFKRVSTYMPPPTQFSYVASNYFPMKILHYSKCDISESPL
jgi:hypothetical protein